MYELRCDRARWTEVEPRLSLLGHAHRSCDLTNSVYVFLRRTCCRRRVTCVGATGLSWSMTSRTAGASRTWLRWRASWTRSSGPNRCLWCCWETRRIWTTPGRWPRRRASVWRPTWPARSTSARRVRIRWGRAEAWRRRFTSSAGRSAADAPFRAKPAAAAPPHTSSKPSTRCWPRSAAKASLNLFHIAVFLSHSLGSLREQWMGE